MSPRIHEFCEFFFAVGLFGKVLTSTLRGAQKKLKKINSKGQNNLLKNGYRKNAFFFFGKQRTYPLKGTDFLTAAPPLSK